MSQSSEFFYYTFHVKFTDAENLSLALEIERLCKAVMLSPLADEFKQEVDALRALLKHLPRNIEPASLTDIYAKIRQLGITEDLFLAALISAELSQKPIKNEKDLSLDERQRIMVQFKPLVVLSCFRILEQKGFTNEVRRACDELRRVIVGYKRENYDLPDLNDEQSLRSVFNSIHYTFDKHSSRYGGYYSCFKLANELGHTPYVVKKAVFSVAQPKSEKIRPKTFQRHQIKTGRITAQINNRRSDNDFGSDVDVEKSNARDYVGTISLVNKRKPTTTTRYQANAISKRIASANRRLPTDIKQATQREIQVLLTVALKQISNSTEYETASKLLTLSLLIGRNFNELQSTNFDIVRENCSLRHEFKAQRYGHVQNYQTEYDIKLPKSFTKLAGNIVLSIMDHEQHAKRLISLINKRHQTKLSLSKIARYLYMHLMSCGVDKTMISLITGPDKGHQISLNYVTLDPSLVNTQFQCYVTDLKQLCRCDTSVLDIDSSYHKAELIGSKAYLTEKELSQLFLNLQTNISAQNNRRHRFSAEFHNKYTLYTYLLLSFTTGFRPVIDMFGYLRDYQISLGVVHIIDKEKGEKNEGRQIYFGEIAKQQIQHYCAYCEFRYRHYKLAKPILAKQYQGVLDSNTPLLFFLSEANEPQTLRPKQIKHIFEEFDLSVMRYPDSTTKNETEELTKETIPINWHRHYVRTFLLNVSLEQNSQMTESLANAWMGHDDNDIPLSRFSHMSIMDLKVIATLLDEHIEALGVRAIEAR